MVSAVIRTAVLLVPYVKSFDMVPPVKMVNSTTFFEPIHISKTSEQACIAQACVPKCQPLWSLLPQWCRDGNATQQLKIHSFPMWQQPGQALTQFGPTKLIGETQIFECMAVLQQERAFLSCAFMIQFVLVVSLMFLAIVILGYMCLLQNRV